MAHTENFKIRTSECDGKMKLTPAAVLDLFQETAGRHCVPHQIDSPSLLKKENKTWVLSGLSVEFNKYPIWPENVDVETWAKSLTGFKALRDYSIKNSQGEIVVNGSSTWALLDMSRRRPCKIDLLDLSMEIDTGRNAIDSSNIKIDSNNVFSECIISEICVTSSNIDVNEHVSNIEYVNWIYQFIPNSFIQNKEISFMNIMYKGEALLNDNLILETSLNSNSGLHKFINKENGMELCIITTHWRDI
ncbi:MAG: hypothetical protein JXR64_11940 [Spirochaetales bacterium]|nr:hypothetical protein [Spirochaetales bacterium]